MGLIQSLICSITFCLERVLTWTCCALVLMLMMFTIIILVVYGISVGYHYSQKELAQYAVYSKIKDRVALRQGENDNNEHLGAGSLREGQTTQAAVGAPESSATPVMIYETERSKLNREKQLALRQIGRYRRSENKTSFPFLRPLKSPTFPTSATP